MNELKPLLLPAAFAYVGVRASVAFAPKSTIGQVLGGVAGALAGLFLAKKV